MPFIRTTWRRLYFNFDPVSNKWGERREVPLISILDSFLNCYVTILKRFIEFINLSWSWCSFSLLVETNFCIKTITSCQNIRLHSLMCKTILPVIFGIITGLKISWFSNISRISIVWGNHIKFFNTLFQPMLHYCRKFEDVKVNIFGDMTL